MKDEEWARLMERARELATVRQERTQVRAVEVSPRSQRIWGAKWHYVMDCPSSCPCRRL